MSLEIVQVYLFGGVKFLDLLAVLMGLDIITGVLKAIKNKKLRSRTAWFGYARKIGVFGAIIAANIIDVVLNLGGAIAYATVLFYIANEGLSVVENLAEIGVKVPTVILNKLHVIQPNNEKGDEQ
ncbi:toxin secretion/phage lysis holin [Metabacillus crassostreae]|uniref:phage holin family protein n=1 Tax=Metabacillus crassostreae TaxID=929098 RepID=UPI00195F0165|nr:phage holin family protein [Metabacillus crassostreae]MBM7605972.1 toxin secretion/phage lysis holin [Metabacillus crassostreae]